MIEEKNLMGQAQDPPHQRSPERGGLSLDDALNGANFDALGGIEVTDAFHAGGGVNYVNVAFADGLGGAFRQTSAASDAIFLNFHSHGTRSLKWF
jgi:hypothetical protein